MIPVSDTLLQIKICLFDSFWLYLRIVSSPASGWFVTIQKTSGFATFDHVIYIFKKSKNVPHSYLRGQGDIFEMLVCLPISPKLKIKYKTSNYLTFLFLNDDYYLLAFLYVVSPDVFGLDLHYFEQPLMCF